MGILMYLLLATGLAANIVWTVFLFRKHRLSARTSPDGLAGVDARVERLLSEIHRVTSANVELIEGRIDALREVGGLADERLKRIRSTLTELEILLNRVSRVNKALSPADAEESVADSELPVREEMPSVRPNSRTETVLNLRRQGLTERQIAQKMGLGVADVQYLVRMAGAAVVESR